MKKKRKILVLAGFIALCIIGIILGIICSQKKVHTLEEIVSGDYSGIEDQKIAEALQTALSNEPDQLEWIFMDLNGDGKEELILRDKDYQTKYMLSIVGIFSLKRGKVVCNLLDLGDVGEFFFLCNGHLMYYCDFWGQIYDASFQEYQMNKNGNFSKVKNLTLRMVPLEEDIPPEWRKMYPGLKAGENYYEEYNESKNSMEVVPEEKWMKDFEELMGADLQTVAPYVYDYFF